MEIFGWICLLGITAWVVTGTLGGIYGFFGLTGKVPWGIIIPVVVSIALICLTYHTAPFTISFHK
ncbi:MAG TPA: hypothetical protein VFM18_14985 [Methanosarcina sp.]|nr:hypothetical protein [Methanosarcina sp.]